MARPIVMDSTSAVRNGIGQSLPIYEGTGTRVNLTATSSASVATGVPGGAKVVEVRATDAIWIKFGDNTVAAAANAASILWTAGSAPLVVPTDGTDEYTYFSVMRVGSSDVAVQVEKIA